MNVRLCAVAGVLIAAGVVSITAQGQESLADALRNELARASKAFGVTSVFTPTNDTDIRSEPGGPVLVGVPRVQKAIASSPSSARTPTIQFYMAHEAWHQVQFGQYGRDIVKAPNEQRQVYECQADLMAAYYLVGDSTDNLKARSAGLTVVLEHMTGLGTLDATLGSHLSRVQRRTAIRLGITRKVVELLRKGPPSEDLASALQYYNRLLDARDGEGDIDWSLRQCQRVVQSSWEAVQMLTIEQRRIDFNSDPKTPYVTFAIAYRNRSDRPMSVSAEVQSAVVPRGDPANYVKIERLDVINAHFELAPGAEHIVSGRLIWHGDEATHPRLVFDATDPGVLLSARFLPGQTTALPDCLTHPAGASDARKVQLRTALARLDSAFAGPASALLEFRRTDEKDNEMFESMVSVPGSRDTTVFIEREGTASVSARLYRGTSQNEAEAVYSKYRTALQSLCSGAPGLLRNRTASSGFPRTDISRFTPDTELEMSMIYLKTRKSYLVSLDLKNRNPAFQEPDADKALDCIPREPGKLTDFEKELGLGLVRLAGSARTGFKEFRIGAANRTDDNSVFYRSWLPIHGAINTDIDLDRSASTRIEATLYEGDSFAQATEVMRRYREDIVSMCPPGITKIAPTRKPNGEERIDIENFTKRSALTLNLWTSSKGRHYTDLELRPRDW